MNNYVMRFNPDGDVKRFDGSDMGFDTDGLIFKADTPLEALRHMWFDESYYFHAGDIGDAFMPADSDVYRKIIVTFYLADKAGFVLKEESFHKAYLTMPEKWDHADTLPSLDLCINGGYAVAK